MGTNLNAHYDMPKNRNNHENLFNFVRAHHGDPAIMVCLPVELYKDFHVMYCQGFIPKLKDNILGRLLNRDYKGDSYGEFTEKDRDSVRISQENIYQCKMLRINYTTYNIRRDTDTISPTMYPDIMVKSPETSSHAQPFWYARVIGIFHALVGIGKNLKVRMDFLWVRWFGVEPGQYQHGFRHARLPKIGFVKSTDAYAFTFINPAWAIRGVHLIPAFLEGRTSVLLPTTKSVARILNPEEEDDWMNFYVNM
jgi:hypothetical protein